MRLKIIIKISNEIVATMFSPVILLQNIGNYSLYHNKVIQVRSKVNFSNPTANIPRSKNDVRNIGYFARHCSHIFPHIILFNCA